MSKTNFELGRTYPIRKGGNVTITHAKRMPYTGYCVRGDDGVWRSDKTGAVSAVKVSPEDLIL